MDKFLSLPEQKQSKIIDAALNTFGTNGYKKASVNDIAAAAGISKAMIFHYFGTKKELYLYLIHYCGDLIIEEVNKNFDSSITDFFDRIMFASDIKLAVLQKHPSALSFLTSAYFEQDGEVKGDIRAFIEQSEGFRNKIAFDGMDTSRFKEGVDPKLVMKILLWMADGFVNYYETQSQRNIKELTNEYYECMNLLKYNFYKEEFIKPDSR